MGFVSITGVKWWINSTSMLFFLGGLGPVVEFGWDSVWVDAVSRSRLGASVPGKLALMLRWF